MPRHRYPRRDGHQGRGPQPSTSRGPSQSRGSRRTPPSRTPSPGVKELRLLSCSRTEDSINFTYISDQVSGSYARAVYIASGRVWKVQLMGEDNCENGGVKAEALVVVDDIRSFGLRGVGAEVQFMRGGRGGGDKGVFEDAHRLVCVGRHKHLIKVADVGTASG